ncbi:MAG: hypothetical protein CVV19_15775 [Gammaproteobacteria bacterium HGW-Gammaproteobacteria-9]|nr:MAG: hypothetical protein CVV19_15775 [Gammaproteobacteria bacterium HGW-Gammaproteobacteria-9]
MSQAPKPLPELDDATLAFAEQVFDSARGGDSARLGELLVQGMPANLCNHAGDSLLMLASYHGHLDASRLLLQHGADPQLRNRRGHTPLAGAAFKGYLATQGADPRASDSNGATALAAARMMGAADTEALLQRLGA